MAISKFLLSFVSVSIAEAAVVEADPHLSLIQTKAQVDKHEEEVESETQKTYHDTWNWDWGEGFDNIDDPIVQARVEQEKKYDITVREMIFIRHGQYIVQTNFEFEFW